MATLVRLLQAMRPKRQRLTEDIIEPLGHRLARLRKERGITQEELAVRLKVSQSSVSEYERDRLRLHADLIIALAKVLNVTTDELLGVAAPSKPRGSLDTRIAQRVALIERLAKRDKDALLRTINGFLAARLYPPRQERRA